MASRRWRSRLHRPETWTEIGRFRAALRARRYDAVVDTQGLMRTALIAKGARGPRHGYDTASIREPLASLLYDVRHPVEWRCHAIPRNRMLTARALGYEPTSEIDFGLDRSRDRRRAARSLCRPDPRHGAAGKGMAAGPLVLGGAGAARPRSRRGAAVGIGGGARPQRRTRRCAAGAARCRSAGRSIRWRR